LASIYFQGKKSIKGGRALNKITTINGDFGSPAQKETRNSKLET
jgi:hypothetical protein